MQSLFEKNSKVHFFDEHGWSSYNGYVREYLEVDLNGVASEFETSPTVVIRRLREYGPLWSRWIAKGDQYELIMRTALFDIYRISNLLRMCGIKVAVFNTGVVHHVDTLIFEQACQLQNVKQLFLYSINVMHGRLLPLLQTTGILSRTALIVHCSNVKATPFIDQFLENKRKQGTPVVGGGLPKGLRYTYLGGVAEVWLSLLGGGVRGLFAKFKMVKDGFKPKSFFSKYDDFYGVLDFYRQIRQQKIAIDYYKNNLSVKPSADECESIRLLIAAHYQPEATSFPEGWDGGNNVDTTIELRRKGYEDVIYYKEHPASLYYIFPIIRFTRIGMARSRDYFTQLQALHCKFLDVNFQLTIDSAHISWYVPVTITGTIAIERALAGLCTIVTGNPWYKGLPGVILLSEIETLYTVDVKWATPDPSVAADAHNFLRAILDNRTIANPTGIGTGVVLQTDSILVEYNSEIESLIRYLLAKFC